MRVLAVIHVITTCTSIPVHSPQLDQLSAQLLINVLIISNIASPYNQSIYHSLFTNKTMLIKIEKSDACIRPPFVNPLT